MKLKNSWIGFVLWRELFDEKKVKLVAIEFKGCPLACWDLLQRKRGTHGEWPDHSWEKIVDEDLFSSSKLYSILDSSSPIFMARSPECW